jgi:hypothetical protein
MCLLPAILFALIFISAAAAALTVPWKEYKLKHGGTVYLPPDWNVSFPPSNFNPDSSAFWIELRATTSKNFGNIEAEITVLWFERGVRVPQSLEDWGQLIRIVSEGQYKTLLQNATLSVISEIPFDSGGKRGVIATHEIRIKPTDAPLMRVIYVLIGYDKKIFLLRINYFPEAENEVKAIAEEILSRWQMPSPSVKYTLILLLVGFTALLALLIWRRKSKEKLNGGGGEDFAWAERPI